AEDYNVTIKVGQGDYIKTFLAHSVILRARSQYFKIALSRSWARQSDVIIAMEKPNIRPKVFEKIICAQIDDGPINENVEIWNSEDLRKFRDIVQDYIPHIRFIASEDYYFRIHPFKKILPSQLKKDLIAHHLAPNAKVHSEILPPRLGIPPPSYLRYPTPPYSNFYDL
ncbi:12985_t:CDS:2, partial [Ambispora gerdemannii]